MKGGVIGVLVGTRKGLWSPLFPLSRRGNQRRLEFSHSFWHEKPASSPPQISDIHHRKLLHRPHQDLPPMLRYLRDLTSLPRTRSEHRNRANCIEILQRIVCLLRRCQIYGRYLWLMLKQSKMLLLQNE